MISSIWETLAQGISIAGLVSADIYVMAMEHMSTNDCSIVLMLIAYSASYYFDGFTICR